MKKPRTYFDNMIKQYGDNWIGALSPESIQRQGNRIVKDMVRGNVDYEAHGKYFLDSKFLENLIIACTNELEISSLHYNATVMYQSFYPHIPNINAIINHDWCLMYIYNTVLYKLKTVRNTGNIGELFDIGGMLSTYKNHIN